MLYSDIYSRTPNCLAVDVGCGTGQLTRVLAPFFNRVIGVDVSQAQITVAKEFTSEGNIEYKLSPAEDLPFLASESVDLLSVATALHYFDRQSFLTEVERILKPGGCLLTIHSTVPSRYYSMVPDTKNEETITQCRLLMNEVSDVISDIIGSRARKMCTTGQYISPSYGEKYKFQTTLWKPLSGLEGFVGLLKSLGGIENYGKENTGKEVEEEVIEVMRNKLRKILLEITSTPETFQLYLTGNYDCNLYRKPSRT